MDYEQTYAKKKLRRQRFLDEMDATVVPRDESLASISPGNYKLHTKGDVLRSLSKLRIAFISWSDCSRCPIRWRRLVPPVEGQPGPENLDVGGEV
jgi:hypothetical protein